MSTEHKTNEEAIYCEALAKAPDQREAYLQTACGQDAVLLARVRVLLKAHEVRDNFLESAPWDPAVVLDMPTLTEGPGTVIGRYKLLEKIGEGGMAVVYMAEQEQPIRRKVALKIIKLGMDTRQVIARFEAERQALALMDHPNIAKVLDAGATETGRPYFVMELVTGVSITEYCDKNSLSTKERLALFLQVCHAVQHAHQKGVIHRDIKPSNVMVTQHDGKAIPKIIDFGIAKATNQRLTEKTLFTRYAHIFGTPAYMSPEQAELTDLDIDTRSDIYSLGVLLYELLTGTTPFSEKELRKAGYIEMQRVIREQEPVKPSTKLSALGEDLTGIAQRRDSTPDSLLKAIQGDLDWIVMKSLEKDRTQRYETAHALAEDLTRHLADEPVLARPHTRTYRLRKFLRKNRRPVSALVAVVMVVTASLILSLVFYADAEEKEREASLQAHIAASERSRAEERELTARRHQYGAILGLAWDQLQEVNIPRVLALLRTCIPNNDQVDLRGFEWYYLWTLCHNDCHTIEGGARCAAYAPDGKSLATGGISGTVRILEVSTGRILRALSTHGEDVFAITFSRDGRWLAARGPGWVRVWSAPAYEAVFTSRDDLFRNPPPDLGKGLPAWMNGGTTEVIADTDIGEKTIAFSPDHTNLFVGAGDGWIVVLKTDTGEECARFKAHDHQVEAIVLSAYRHSLLTTGGQKRRELRAWDRSSPGRQFASASGNLRTRELKRWDLTQPDSPRILSTDLFPGARAFSPDTGILATYKWEGPRNSVELWRTDNRQKISSFDVQGPPVSMAFSPDGESVAVGSLDNTVELYQVATGRKLKILEGQRDALLSVSVSTNGQTIALCSGRETRIWDTSRNPARLDAPVYESEWQQGLRTYLPDKRRLGLRFSVAYGGCFAVTADGRCLNARPGIPTVMVAEDGANTAPQEVAWVEDVHAIDALTYGDPYPRAPTWMSCSPDGKFLAIAGVKGSVILWDLEQHKKTAELIPLTSRKPVDPFQRLPAELREKIKSPRRRPPEVTWGPLDFSPDGRVLVLGNNVGDGLLWDRETNRELHRFDLQGTVGAVAFSGDGERVAFATAGRVTLWRVRTGDKLATVEIPAPRPPSPGLRKGVSSMAFPPEGDCLAIGFQDGTIIFWDLATAMERFALKQPEGSVGFLAFGHDGRTLVSGHGAVTYLWRGHWETVDVAAPGQEERPSAPEPVKAVGAAKVHPTDKPGFLSVDLSSLFNRPHDSVHVGGGDNASFRTWFGEGVVTADGVPFHIRRNGNDVLVSANNTQNVFEIKGFERSAQRLHFLLWGYNNPWQPARLEIRFKDGSSQAFDLSLGEWTRGEPPVAFDFENTMPLFEHAAVAHRIVEVNSPEKEIVSVSSALGTYGLIAMTLEE